MVQIVGPKPQTAPFNIKLPDRQALKELREAAKHHSKRYLSLDMQSTRPRKAPKTAKKQAQVSNYPVVAVQAKEVILATSRGRTIQRPQRFNI